MQNLQEHNSNFETKGVIDILTNAFRDLFKLGTFKTKVDNKINTEYNSGISAVEKQYNPNFNIIPQKKDLDFLSNYVNQNLQNHADKIGDDLRQEISRGILNKENQQTLAKRLKETLKGNKKLLLTRLKMVFRTEMNRANNTGILQGAEQYQEQSGEQLVKWLQVVMDDRTSNLCLNEHHKYGTPEQAIPLNKDFEVTYKPSANKTKSSVAKNPPFHPNCRTVLRTMRQSDWEKQYGGKK